MAKSREDMKKWIDLLDEQEYLILDKLIQDYLELFPAKVEANQVKETGRGNYVNSDVIRILDNVPYVDEELNEEELKSINEAEEAISRRETKSLEQFKREQGL